jgi:hypothetical protein
MTRVLCILMVLLLLAGCGGGGGSEGGEGGVGGSSLTGGSVPTGDIDGTLYATPETRESYMVMSGVPVTAFTTDGTVLQRTVTGIDGAFLFTHIPLVPMYLDADDALTGKHARITIDADALTAHTSVELVLAPPPGPEVAGVLLSPSKVQIEVGEQVTFRAQSLVSNHTPGAVVPVSWAVKGGIGTIDVYGVFTATNEGNGRVVAQYGDRKDTVLVKVKTSPARAAHGR